MKPMPTSMQRARKVARVALAVAVTSSEVLKLAVPIAKTVTAAIGKMRRA